MRAFSLACSAALATALHAHGSAHFTSVGATAGCVPPGQCTPPASPFSRVQTAISPGQQWNIAGGFCGAFSLQHAALSTQSGCAWISQDLVRKANVNQPPPYSMHGDKTVGYEVMPSNVAFTASALRLRYAEWDYMQPAPQAEAYKAWLKAHLAAGHPVVWFPICKGDGHDCYPGSCPNGGSCDHVEVMYGLYSSHALDDPAVYEDDWIVHTSDQDLQPYYRPINSLMDTVAMDGNCAKAVPGYGHNEMYPCFDSSVTYGLALYGLDVNSTAASPLFPVSVLTPGAVGEPNVRLGEPAVLLTGTITVSGLTAGTAYVLFRYNGTAALPAGPPFAKGAQSATPFTAKGATWSVADPVPFWSDTAVYWLASTA